MSILDKVTYCRNENFLINDRGSMPGWLADAKGETIKGIKGSLCDYLSCDDDDVAAWQRQLTDFMESRFLPAVRRYEKLLEKKFGGVPEFDVEYAVPFQHAATYVMAWDHFKDLDPYADRLPAGWGWYVAGTAGSVFLSSLVVKALAKAAEEGGKVYTGWAKFGKVALSWNFIVPIAMARFVVIRTEHKQNDKIVRNLVAILEESLCVLDEINDATEKLTGKKAIDVSAETPIPGGEVVTPGSGSGSGSGEGLSKAAKYVGIPLALGLGAYVVYSWNK